MKQFILLLCACISLSVYAQDTTCVMITLDEILNFDYYSSEVTSRYDHSGDLQLKVKDGEVLCLHFLDEKKRYRDLVTTFDDNSHIHNTVNSKDNVLYTQENWGEIIVEISEPRKQKTLK